MDMLEKTLTMHIDGVASHHGGDLLLSVLKDKLEAFDSLAHEVSALINKNGKSSYEPIKVVDISKNSPMQFKFATSSQNQVFIYLPEWLNEITSENYIDTSFPPSLIEKVINLCKGIGEKIGSLRFSNNGAIVAEITKETFQHAKEISEKIYFSYGSITGVIRKYNSGANKKTFNVYPEIGDPISCVFNESLINLASSAVEKNVEVTGKLKYKGNNFNPIEVEVLEINIIPEQSQLPKLSDLLGLSKNITLGMDTVDFIKELRNGR
jgi:hypothetical protein